MFDKIFSFLMQGNTDVSDPKVRTKYGILAGIIGLIISFLLFVTKLIIGILSGSIGIIADAFNMLGDFGSCLVVVIGFKLSAKPPDEEHPYGHGRIEYIAAFIISMIIIILGVELLKNSIIKIFNPEVVTISLGIILVYILSIFIVVLRRFTYLYVGKKINSMSIIAAAKDSKNDIISSLIFLLGLVVSRISGVNLDGYLGTIIAIFIVYSGYGIAKETITSLLGQAPDKNIVAKIKQHVSETSGIVGIHDLVIHNYGPSKCFAYLHAEVSSDMNINQSHEIIDKCECEIRQQLGIELVIHVDPVDVNNELANKIKNEIIKIVGEYNSEFSIHDIRIIECGDIVDIVFDLIKPYNAKISNEKVINDINNLAKEIDEKYNCIIHFD